MEAKLEEGLDLKNQFRIKNLPDPISIREAASKSCKKLAKQRTHRSERQKYY